MTERKQVTVLFADAVGSTVLIDVLVPDEAHARLRPALDAMMDAVRRYEATVNRAQGDGIMVALKAAVRAIDSELEDTVPALLHLMGLPVDDPIRDKFGPAQQHRLVIDLSSRASGGC